MSKKKFNEIADTIVTVVCGDLGFFGYVETWDDVPKRVPFYGLDGLREAVSRHVRGRSGFSVVYATRSYPTMCDIWAGWEIGDADPIVWDALGIGNGAGRAWAEWAAASANTASPDAKIAKVLLALDAGAPIASDGGDILYYAEGYVPTLAGVIKAARRDGYIK